MLKKHGGPWQTLVIGATSQKTVIFVLTALRTSNVILLLFFTVNQSMKKRPVSAGAFVCCTPTEMRLLKLNTLPAYINTEQSPP